MLIRVLCSYFVYLSSVFVRCVYDDAMMVVCFEWINDGFPVIVRDESFDRNESRVDYFGDDGVKMVDTMSG